MSSQDDSSTTGKKHHFLKSFLDVRSNSPMFNMLLFKSSRSLMFFKIGVLKNFAIFTRKQVLESLLNKVADLKAFNFKKKRLHYGDLLVNIAKFLRTVFFIENLWWLLLVV